MTMELARYEADSGKEIVITDDDIKYAIAGNQNVTNVEMRLFVELCMAHHFDPFIKEVHLIKFKDKPATIVIGKDVWLKRAMRNQRYKGHQAGMTFIGADGKIRRREGSMILDGEKLIGAWAKVYIGGYEAPVYDEVSFQEYAQKKYDGSLMANWAKMPATMLRKVALVHALREAFPDEFGGCYDASEMGVEIPTEAKIEQVSNLESEIEANQQANLQANANFATEQNASKTQANLQANVVECIPVFEEVTDQNPVFAEQVGAYMPAQEGDDF